MKSQLTYQPFKGLEYAWSPELVCAKNERPDQPDIEQEVDTSGLRPVRVVERVNSFKRGRHTVTTTTVVYTNRPAAHDHPHHRPVR